MQSTVNSLIWLEIEDFFNQIVFSLTAAQAVAMSNEDYFSVDVEKLFFPINHSIERFLEIVAHPHVVIAGENMYFSAFFANFVKIIEESEIAFGNDVAVFEPKVEDVAQEEEVIQIGVLPKHVDECLFAAAACIVFRRLEMSIRHKQTAAVQFDNIHIFPINFIHSWLEFVHPFSDFRC